MDQGIKYSSYTQISPERDVSNSAFSKGQINFRINLDSMSRWNPYRSYFRMRVSLQSTVANQPQFLLNSKVAPNMFQGDCFWQQMNLSCNGVKVSQIDDYYIQVAALKQRMMYDQSRRDNMLADTNFGQARINDRICQVQAGGFERNAPSWEPFWQLHQEDGGFVLDTDECKVQVATPTILEYRTAADAGIGTINLLQSELNVGDWIKISEATQAAPALAYTVRQIIAMTVNTMTLDRPITAFGAADLTVAGTKGCLIYYSKNRPSRSVSTYELIYRPKLGFFQIDDFLPGNYQLELTPWKDGQWNRFTVETLGDLDPDNWDINVLDMQFYAYTGMASTRVSGTKSYQFSETRCQSQTITNRSLMNKAFVVNKDSHMYTIAFQAGTAGDDTSLSRAKYKCAFDYEKKIRRYQLRCGGYTLPTPLPDILKDRATYTDLSTQQYYEELMYTKSGYLADPESLTEWYERGPYYAYRMPKPIDNPSNRLYVSVEFDPPDAPDVFENFQLLVFDTYYTGFSVTLDNGIITKTTRDVMIN